MRNVIIIVIIFFVVLSSASFSLAAPVGNIAAPSDQFTEEGLLGEYSNSDFRLFVAPEVDLTFDRDLENSAGDSELYFYGTKIGVAAYEKVIVYSLLGGGSAEQEFTISGSAVKYYTNHDFIWGGGATILFYEKEMFSASFQDDILRIGADIRYRKLDFDLDSIHVDGTSFDFDNTAVGNGTFEANEWQIALAASYEYNNFFPYLGVKYSDIDGDANAVVTGTRYKNTFEPEKRFGIFVGTDIIVAEKFSINVEGRFLDETALSLGASAKF